MDIFNVLTMIGGLCLFLFGMNLMGQALERRAGGKLRSLLDKMTGSVFAGFLTGLGITAIIQSSSATTVMVVGFVNSGLMTLRQAINVIMGANVGTTVTAWLLSLGGIDSGNFWIKLLKPSSFTPVLALIGIIYYMFCKDNKKKDTGMILLGFATLMFGMETMSGAVAGLKDVPAFTNLFVAFQNPILGVLAGALLTAIIQSSSASVGILQALAVTGCSMNPPPWRASPSHTRSSTSSAPPCSCPRAAFLKSSPAASSPTIPRRRVKRRPSSTSVFSPPRPSPFARAAPSPAKWRTAPCAR